MKTSSLLSRCGCVLAASALSLAWMGSAAAQSDKPASLNKSLVERGRYLARIAGCNDCHTPGYAQSGGKVDEKVWLTGDALGWRGPWGTTYPANLRLYMQNLTEVEWVKRAKTLQARPPMPWFALHDMSERDIRALYHYVKSLPVEGQPAPAYVPPDQAPKGPYVQFP